MRPFAMVLVLLFAVPVFAAGGACRADAQRLCPGTPRGAERRTCMKAHKAELSQACLAQRAAHKQRRPHP